MTKVAWNKGLISIDWDSKVQTVLDGRFKFVERISAERGEAKLILRCSTCGTEKTVASSMLRGTNAQRIRCSACFSNECREARQEKKEQDKIIKEFDRLRKRQKSEHQMTFNFCKCGQLIPFERKSCDECIRKSLRASEMRKETKRRIRAKTSHFDSDITLERLYERDKGVCYLCNEHCSWEDYRKENGIFIIGSNYPTIEHVIALCNGGSHSWDNVKLACHACNSKKGKKLLVG